MIGLVVAMDSETQAIGRRFESVTEYQYGGLTIYLGKMFGKDVVMVKSGVGKVNAAIAATVICELFHPKVLISTGIAGGLGRSDILDVVIADRVVQHDYDTTPLGEPKGIISPVDMNVLVALKRILPNAKVGTIASGDQFISSGKAAALIVRDFDAYACEMECAAVARVAQVFGVPFDAIKVISDGGGDGAALTFTEMCNRAGEMNAYIVGEFIKGY